MTVYEKFQNPAKEYTTVPFWFWNDKIDKTEIVRQLNLMHEQKVYECVIHARYGLETPYFSEEWFECIGFTIREGKRLGMRFWIYDENNFPSGYAGGKVLAEQEAAWSVKALIFAFSENSAASYTISDGLSSLEIAS